MNRARHGAVAAEPEEAGRERPGPAPLPAAAQALLRLQATAGNAEVARMMSGAQFQLTVSRPGEEAEREADRLADRIVRSTSPAAGATGGAGVQLLPADLRREAEPLVGRDLGGVRVHTGGAAAEAAGSVGARAFTVGDDIAFGAGQYDPGTPAGHRLLAHELAHTAQQAAGHAPAVQRKEVGDQTALGGAPDWTTADREGNSARWQAACLANLQAADSRQYVKVVERRDFYKWFYEYTYARGFGTRWALAAYVVADGAHQIADMDAEHAFANDSIGLAGVELQGAMREGNQVIFDNVLPKLKRLLEGGPLKGRAALEWDMQVLSQEQVLVQPLYDSMSAESREELNYIARKKRFAGAGAWWTDEDKIPAGPGRNAGEVPAFDQPSMTSVKDRWTYGMLLGNQFTPGGTGFDQARDTRPPASAGYWDGTEFARVDTRAHLHQLDAWLNPDRYSRMGPGGVAASTYLRSIIAKLTAFEKSQVLTDRSPDGWAYSTQFAQFGFVTDALVTQALPDEPVCQAQVKAFLARFAAEQAKVPSYDPGLMMVP